MAGNARVVAARLLKEYTSGQDQLNKDQWIIDAALVINELLKESVVPKESVTYTFRNQDFCGNKHYMRIRDNRIRELKSFTGANLSLYNVTRNVPELELAIERAKTPQAMILILDIHCPGKTHWELVRA
jgi:hypothetical protein